MKNEDWALKAAYVFIGKRYHNTKLSESYRLLGCNASEMNSMSQALFGSVMSKLYRQIRAGTAKSKKHFEPTQYIKLTSDGVAVLRSKINSSLRIKIELSNVHGCIDDNGNALLLIKGTRGHQVIKANMSNGTKLDYVVSDHIPTALTKHLHKNNLINELKILECIRD